MTSETGAITESLPLSSVHSVRIESESLPTGMVMPSLAQRSTPTALTVAYRSASSPGSPQAAIQFADNRISVSSRTSAAMILVIASPTASRPEAGASSNATGARSPIAIASPA